MKSNLIIFAIIFFIIFQRDSIALAEGLFPVAKSFSANKQPKLEVEGYGSFEIMWEYYKPEIFWKCKEGYLVNGGAKFSQIFSVNRSHRSPWNVIAQYATVKSKLGVVFFEPIDNSVPGNLPDVTQAEIIAESFESLCAKGQQRPEDIDLYMNYLIKRENGISPNFGKRLLDKPGTLQTPWPDTGKYFVAIGHAGNENPYVVVCNASICRKTEAYQGEWIFPKFTYVGNLVTIQTENKAGKRLLLGVVNDDLSVTMQKEPTANQ